jgi:hypothetical protein
MTYRVERRDGTPVAVTPRIEAFVRRYAERWERRHAGRQPSGQHPFPFLWDYTFIVDFDEPYLDPNPDPSLPVC